jgi:hypothetical protein
MADDIPSHDGGKGVSESAAQRHPEKFGNLADLRYGAGAPNTGHPKIFTLAEVLRSLAGICGRTFVLEHLKKMPEFDGGPTHRRIGNKIVFYEDDISRFMASLERQPEPAPSPRRMEQRASISADKAYRNAMKLVARLTEEARTKPKASNKR